MAITITATAVRALVAEGKTRKEIAEHFGASQQEMNRKVWSQPGFKGAKRNMSPVTFIDDENGAVASENTSTAPAETAAAPAQEEASAPADDIQGDSPASEAEGTDTAWQ
jgi:hypothetical protein